MIFLVNPKDDGVGTNDICRTKVSCDTKAVTPCYTYSPCTTLGCSLQSFY